MSAVVATPVRVSVVRPVRALGFLRAVFMKSIAVVGLLALWESVPRLGLIDSTFLPPFSEVASRGRSC
jgi:NitT/TauT family transport system permease protein